MKERHRDDTNFYNDDELMAKIDLGEPNCGWKYSESNIFVCNFCEKKYWKGKLAFQCKNKHCKRNFRDKCYTVSLLVKVALYYQNDHLNEPSLQKSPSNQKSGFVWICFYLCYIFIRSLIFDLMRSSSCGLGQSTIFGGFFPNWKRSFSEAIG